MLGKFPPEFRKWKTRGIDWAGVAANQPSVSKHKLLHPPEFSKPCARARAHSALRDRVNFPTSRRGIECNRITRSRRLISRNSKIIPRAILPPLSLLSISRGISTRLDIYIYIFFSLPSLRILSRFPVKTTARNRVFSPSCFNIGAKLQHGCLFLDLFFPWPMEENLLFIYLLLLLLSFLSLHFFQFNF